MGYGPKVMDLPIDIRAELDQRLRAANYGDLAAAAAWLTEKAYPVGKSSIHRYAQGLRALDTTKGREDSELLIAIRNANGGSSISGRKAALLLRLGAIEFERARLLAELEPLMVGDQMRDDPTIHAATHKN